MNSFIPLALVCLVLSCKSVGKQEWARDAASSCDSGARQNVKINLFPGDSEEDRIATLDAVVYGACGKQLVVDIDSSFTFQMKHGDSVVRIDLRFDGVVVENWTIHSGRFDEEWSIGVDRRPFVGEREDDAPDFAEVFYFICYGGVCVGQYH